MFNWKSAVSTVAPMLGTAIGGPFGGMAAKFITDALGLTDGADESEIEEAVRKNPEALVRIKEAEHAFKTRMKELDIRKDQLEFRDRDSARKREMVLKDKTPAILAILITVGFFGLLGVFIFIPIPPTATTILNVMIGSLGTAWVAIVNYYFGSSSSSREKNMLIANNRG